MLHTENIQFAYPAIQFIFPDISCKAGEAVLVTGSSGKGKTTLLHLLAGILRPSAGAIVVNETDITKLKDRRLDKFRGQHIGIVFQQPHFIASLSVVENMLLAPYFSDTAIKKDKVTGLLSQLQVAEQAGKKPSTLSQGQQQRVSIARALMNNPQLILADEPTSSLDDENCAIVATLLKEQAQMANAALVIVTHDQRLKSIFNRTIHLL